MVHKQKKLRKIFKTLFRKNNLNIIVKCNLKIVDYLDVTLNLSDGSYKPFHKPNSEINYIHRESNHPPSITKQFPLSVESSLSKVSSDEYVFIQAASIHQEALKRAGYNQKLKRNNSDKYNSNNNNNKDNCYSNDTKNDNNYSNNKFKFSHNDNWDNNDNNNNKDNFNCNKGSNDNLLVMIIGLIMKIIMTIIPVAMIIGIVLKIRIILLLLLIIISTVMIMIIIIQGQRNSKRET